VLMTIKVADLSPAVRRKQSVSEQHIRQVNQP
jgi:hypothetical protein